MSKPSWTEELPPLVADVLKEAQRYLQRVIESAEVGGDYGARVKEDKPAWWNGDGDPPPDDFVLDEEARMRASSALYVEMVRRGAILGDGGLQVNPEEIDEMAVLTVLAFMGYKPRTPRECRQP